MRHGIKKKKKGNEACMRDSGGGTCFALRGQTKQKHRPGAKENDALVRSKNFWM